MRPIPSSSHVQVSDRSDVAEMGTLRGADRIQRIPDPDVDISIR
jgi:hypothetical protein